MTQNRYHPEAEIVYRRHRSGPFLTHRPGPQAYAIPQRPPPSMNQAEADKGHSRKRIAVAVRVITSPQDLVLIIL